MSICSATSMQSPVAIDLSIKEKPYILIGPHRVPIDRGIMITREGFYHHISIILNCNTAIEGHYAKVMLMLCTIENMQKCTQLILENSKAVLQLNFKYIKMEFRNEVNGIRPIVEFGLYYNDFDERELWPPLFFPKDQFTYEVSYSIINVDKTVDYEVKHGSHGFIRLSALRIISNTIGSEAEQVSRIFEIFNRLREKTCSSISIDEHLGNARANAFVSTTAPTIPWQDPKTNWPNTLNWVVSPTFVTRLEDFSHSGTEIEGTKEIENWLNGSSIKYLNSYMNLLQRFQGHL